MATENETESIVDALRASFTEVEAAPEADDTEAPPENPEPVDVAPTDDGEDTPPEENEVVVAADEDSPAEEPPEVFHAPEHWSSEVKESFAALPPEAQEILLDRDKEFQTGYQEKVQGITDIQSALEPWKQTIAQLGVSEAQAIRTLFSTYNSLLNDPRSGIQALAQNFGLSDQFAVPDTDDDYADPAVKALQAQVTGLTGQLQNIGQQQQQNVTTQGQQVITDFKAVKDEAGKPAHPFFDEALHLMTPLVQQGKTLEEAYEEAKWSVPAYRDSQATAPAPTAEQKAAKVLKARKAANSVKQKGNESPSPEDPQLTLNQELAAAWKQSQN